MPTNDELTVLMHRVSALEGQVATLVSDLINSRDRVTDRLFQVIDQTNKITTTDTTGTSPTVSALNVSTSSTAMP